MWLPQKAQGTELWADVPWPVEARFLARCVDDARIPLGMVHGNLMEPCSREFEGPYPLFDVRSLVKSLQIPHDQPDAHWPEIGAAEGPVIVHHPLCDAKVSAQKLIRVKSALAKCVPE